MHNVTDQTTTYYKVSNRFILMQYMSEATTND